MDCLLVLTVSIEPLTFTNMHKTVEFEKVTSPEGFWLNDDHNIIMFHHPLRMW